jgi:hypothetical protein
MSHTGMKILIKCNFLIPCTKKKVKYLFVHVNVIILTSKGCDIASPSVRYRVSVTFSVRMGARMECDGHSCCL